MNPTMVQTGDNVDELMRRHFEPVVRLHDAGRSALAFEAALAALGHEPPSTDSPILMFFLHPLLTSFLHDGNAIGLRKHVLSRPSLRKETLWWVQFYLNTQRDETVKKNDGQALTRQLKQIRDRLEKDPVASDVPSPLSPGCVRCVVVDPTGIARMTRVYVRFGEWTRLDQDAVAGQVAPGAKAALDAAQQYLTSSGCKSIDGLQAEILVEGGFGPIHGESLALAIFVAAISARLEMSVASHWAFTGAVGSPSVESSQGTVMPVNELRAKLAACGEGGCSHLVVPPHMLADDVAATVSGGCELLPVATTTETLAHVLSEHCLPELPRIVGWREYTGEFMKALVSGWKRSAAMPHDESHRTFRAIVPWVFAVMLT
jgi:hypothetical protein